MADQSILTHTFPSGLTLLAEPMPWLESAAFSFVLSAGCINDPLELPGRATLTCELVQRGAGSRDSRKFVADLERLGVHRSASVSTSHTSYGGAVPAENLDATLPLFVDQLLRPHLPEDQFDDARQVCYQEMRSVEDDLSQKVLLELRKRNYADPWGRPPHVTEASLEAITIDDVRRHYAECYTPQNAILSVAGNIDWPKLRDQVGTLLADWQSKSVPKIVEAQPQRGYLHIDHPSQQTHIGLAYAGLPYRHPDYYQARGAVGVLSDGMSSRLFSEVREKRGLCYTVFASCHSLKDRGSVLCYSGTSTDRAQETLNVILAELNRLTEGIQQSELDRLKARIKSTLIMQQESSPGRCSSMAGDWYHLGEVRTLDEVLARIDALSVESINAYLAANPPRDFTVVTLGASPLEVSVAVS